MNSTDYEFHSDYKKEIIKKIKELRKRGGTFVEIARHFNRKGYDTFSGRGEWHAQTIHRLFSTN